MNEGLQIGLTRSEAMGRTTVVVVVLIVALVGLYLVKRRTGSQQWRVKVPAGVHRAVMFVIWLVCKKVPWRPLVIWGPWVVMIVVASFYGIENWRGKRAWEKAEGELRARGDELDVRAYELEPIPDAENFALDPVVRGELARSRRDPLPRLRSFLEVGKPYPANDRNRGVHLDVRQWMSRPGKYATSKEAALHALTLLEPYRARMEALAQATVRPGWHVPWVCSGNNPLEWEIDRDSWQLARWMRLFRERAFLRVAANDPDGAVEDFGTTLRLTAYLAKGTTMSRYQGGHRLGAYLDELVWELLSNPAVDPEQLRDLEPFLASLDPRRELIRSVKFDRAFGLSVLEYSGRHRKFARELCRDATFVRLRRDWTPDWVDEADEWLNGIIVATAPRGWFSRGKARLVEIYDTTMLRPDGVEVERLRIDAERRVGEARHRLGRGFSEQVLNDFVTAADYRLTAVYRQQVVIDQMRIALALERYRKRVGGYPDRLEALVPELPGAPPLDPMTERPYHYRIKEDGTPLLWSVGGDGVDDGGVPSTSRFGDTEMDWVWQYTAAP